MKIETCETSLTIFNNRGFGWIVQTFCQPLGLVRVLPKLHKFFTKVSYKASLFTDNSIFLFVRSQLSVRVMYWNWVEDYFYPFHEVCMHLLWSAEAASQSDQEIIVHCEFWKFVNLAPFRGFGNLILRRS